MIELRWKTKERKVLMPNGQWGGGTHEVTETYRVLEYRDRLNENVATNWTEVPEVGVSQ